MDKYYLNNLHKRLFDNINSMGREFHTQRYTISSTFDGERIFGLWFSPFKLKEIELHIFIMKQRHMHCIN